jgi:phosphohistidine phosphatase SixA
MTKHTRAVVSIVLPSTFGVVIGAAVFVGLWGLPGGAARAQDASRGDANGDGSINIADAVYVLQYLFAQGPPPSVCARPARAREIFIVRHAEKESTGADPGLTPDGQARAQRLADLFARQRVDALYASEKRRTYDTVLPLATAKGMEIVRFDQINAMPAMVQALKALPPGVVVVVAAHSYTIDEILTGLGIPTPSDLSTSIYDDLFLVTLPVEEGAAPVFVNLRYL